MSAKPDICIYHAPCQDGFTAAWAVWKRWGDEVAYHPGVHGEAPPDVTGKHVLIVDFSYRRQVLQQMGAVAASITILDHHKSAQADLAPFVVEALGEAPVAFVDEGLAGLAGPYPIQAVFDMERSGAGLTWDLLHPGAPRPLLIEYVEDRDLWRFTLAGTREFTAELFSQPYSFAEWEIAAGDLEHAVGRDKRFAQGQAITRKHDKDVAELLDQTARYMVIGGHRVPVANLPYTMCSDGANRLAEGNPFAATYFDRADGARVFSLRSTEGGLDVSEIAFALGGGGHARAAGFTAAAGWEGEGA